MDAKEKARKLLAKHEARVTELRNFLRTYDSLDSVDEHEPPLGFLLNEARRSLTAKARIIEAVEELLQTGAPRPTRTLLDDLNNRGIHVGGKDKVLALSSILSREKGRFKADRSKGWSLK